MVKSHKISHQVKCFIGSFTIYPVLVRAAVNTDKPFEFTFKT